jgi:hypothetical protein
MPFAFFPFSRFHRERKALPPLREVCTCDATKKECPACKSWRREHGDSEKLLNGFHVVQRRGVTAFTKIPFDLITRVHALRMEGYSMKKIAETLHVPLNRIQTCVQFTLPEEGK